MKHNFWSLLNFCWNFQYFKFQQNGVCCISEGAFNQILKHLQPPNLNSTKNAPKFLAANGNLMDTLGKYNLKFKISDREVNQQFDKIRLLEEDVIPGIDFIYQNHLNHVTETKGFFWKGTLRWNTGLLKVNKATTLKKYTIRPG